MAQYVEEADHLRHQNDIKHIYARRKETIERVFAAMNLKKLANWTWQTPEIV